MSATSEDRFEELYERYSDRTLSDAERVELERLMADPAMRRRFVELTSLDTLISEESRLAESTPAAIRKKPATYATRKPRITPIFYALSAAATILLAAGIFWFTRPSTSAPQIVATITHWQGEPAIRRGTQQFIATAGMNLLSGDIVSTKPEELLACQFAADATRVDIHENSSLTFAIGPTSKRLELTSGKLSANVAPQPPNAPILVITPDAETRVIGTRLSVSIERQQTTLQVHEGHVRLKRLKDNAEVDVKTGGFVVSSDTQAPLVPLTIPAVKSFSLVSADTGDPVPAYNPIRERGEIIIATLPTSRLFIAANVTGKVGSVKFEIEGYSTIISRAPFVLNIEYARRMLKPEARANVPYLLKATPYSEPEGRGLAGESYSNTGTIIVKR